MEIILKNLRKIMKDKEKLEKELRVKIELKGKKIYVSGDAENEYVTERVLEAIDVGFDIEQALLLRNIEYIMEIIPIKSITNKANLKRVRARVIGTKGKTLALMQELSNCYIVLHENIVYIIGDAEKIKIARNAVESLISGSKQSSVYSYLEKPRKRFKYLGKVDLKLNE